MNRRVTIVLVCTFLALVAATLWVPIEGEFVFVSASTWMFPYEGRQWAWCLSSWAGIRWGLYGLQLGLPVLCGGLLALFFRTRAARGAA